MLYLWKAYDSYGDIIMTGCIKLSKNINGKDRIFSVYPNPTYRRWKRMIKKMSNDNDWQYFITLTFTDKLNVTFGRNRLKESVGYYSEDYRKFFYPYANRKKVKITFDANLTMLKRQKRLSGDLVSKLLNTITTIVKRNFNENLRNKRLFSYCWKYEEGSRYGRAHFHLLLSVRHNDIWQLSDQEVFNLFRKYWRFGIIDILKVRPDADGRQEMVSKYLNKYFSKSNKRFRHWKLRNKRLWSTSNDIPTPESYSSGCGFHGIVSYRNSLKINRELFKETMSISDTKEKSLVRKELNFKNIRRNMRKSRRAQRVSFVRKMIRAHFKYDFFSYYDLKYCPRDYTEYETRDLQILGFKYITLITMRVPTSKYLNLLKRQREQLLEEVSVITSNKTETNDINYIDFWFKSRSETEIEDQKSIKSDFKYYLKNDNFKTDRAVKLYFDPDDKDRAFIPASEEYYKFLGL